MTWTDLFIYVFAASFVLMGLAMLFAYRRTGHYGLFMMGMTYGASAGLAIVLTRWWPLVAGYALVWVLKLLGLDPDRQVAQQREEASGQEPRADRRK